MKFSNVIISNSIVIFKPENRLDITNAAELESLLDKLRKLYPIHNFIIDLAKVDYLSSSALRVIVTTHRKLTEASLSLVLLNPTSMCSRILEVTELDDFLGVYTSEKEAIDFFNK